jgi:hypothetical protein
LYEKIFFEVMNIIAHHKKGYSLCIQNKTQMKTLIPIIIILVLINTGCRKEEQADYDSSAIIVLQSDLNAAKQQNASVVMWHDSALHCTTAELIRHCDSMRCYYDGQYHNSCSMFTQHHNQYLNGNSCNNGSGSMGGSGMMNGSSGSCTGDVLQLMNDMQSLSEMHQPYHSDCSNF